MKFILTEYLTLFYFLIITFCVIFFLLLLTWLFMTKHYVNEKLSSYECGFEPFTDASKCFNVNFYSYGLSFLLFDVELLLILPGLYSLYFFTFLGRFSFYCSLLLLIFGLFYELRGGYLTIQPRIKNFDQTV